MTSNLLAISFAYIFKAMSSKAIGQKCLGEEGSLPVFGRITTNALSISVGKVKETVAEL